MEALYNSILVRLGEFMVREGSSYRAKLVSRLRESIARTLAKHGLRGEVIVRGGARIVVDNIDSERLLDYISVLSRVFGVSSISPAVEIDYEFSEILGVMEKLVVSDKPRSIRLVVEGEPGIRRSLLVKALTAYLVNTYGLYINLEKPDAEYIVEVREGKAYIMRERVEGPGGLPYGVEGCLVVLFSGGVDSMLATWSIMKRGVEPIILYNSLGNYWSIEAHKRFYEALDKIYGYIPWDYVKVYITRGLEKLIAQADIPDRLRCLLCKSLMYNVASRVADREKCLGIATGEAIGQVASQTLSNLYLLSRTIDKPVYRPLSSMDKIEIIRYADKLGFSTLSRSVGQCMLKPAYPETNATMRDYELIMRIIREYSGALDEVVDNAEVIIYKGSGNVS